MTKYSFVTSLATALLVSCLGSPLTQPVSAQPVSAQPAPAAIRVLAPIPVWPQGLPDDGKWAGALAVPVAEEQRDNGAGLFNVTHPTLQAYLPPVGHGNGIGIMVAPGGGFRFLAIRNEGDLVARWLAEHGYAAFVLKYRVVVQAPGETVDALRKRMAATMNQGQIGEAGVADGRQALRMLHVHAADYGLDPHKIGVVGFSAGAHIAGMLAHQANKADRADFAGLIYGLPFPSTLPPIPAANLPFPPGTPTQPWLQPKPTPAPDALPPLFIAMAQDDVTVGVGVREYYAKLFDAGYRPETHLYAHGLHGFGLRGVGSTADHWIEEFDWWLRDALHQP